MVFHRNNVSGFSLIEVIIASVILTLISVCLLVSLIQSSHAARINSNAFSAKNITQSYFERMALDRFDNVNPPVTASGYVAPKGGYPTIEYDSANPVYLDKALNIRCKVEFKFKGTGVAESGSVNTLQDTQANWVTDEWAGSILYIVSGKGAGQFAPITSNNANTITCGSNFVIAPAAGSGFMINNGRTVEITTYWQYRGKEHHQTVRSLITNDRNNPLGL